MARKALGIMSFGVVLAFALALVPAMRADVEHQSTQFTFSAPVRLPNRTVLPAGTYWFQVPDINHSQIVQVFNADHTKVITTLFTDDTDRFNAADNTKLTLAPMGRREPPALVSWFYPDRLIGHEFVYSPRMENRVSESNQYTVTPRSVPLVKR